MTYSMEFRQAVARAYDECGPSIQVAEQFECYETITQFARLCQPRIVRGSLKTSSRRAPTERWASPGYLCESVPHRWPCLISIATAPRPE
jgi:hypothetical protein